MVIKLKPRVVGDVIKETVLIGVDEEHLEVSGELSYNSLGDWQLFGCALLIGADGMRGQVRVLNHESEEFINGLVEKGVL